MFIENVNEINDTINISYVPFTNMIKLYSYNG